MAKSLTAARRELVALRPELESARDDPGALEALRVRAVAILAAAGLEPGDLVLLENAHG